MRHWQQAGIAEVHTAFSAAPDHPYRFVQDAITADSDGIWHAIQVAPTSTSAATASAWHRRVRETLATIYRQHTLASADDAEKGLGQLEKEATTSRTSSPDHHRPGPRPTPFN